MSSVWEWLFGNAPIAWIQELFGLGHPVPFRAASLLGDTWGVIFVAGLAFWLFGRRALHAVLGMVVAATALRLGMAALVGQSRPAGPEIVSYRDLSSGSFPSGHTMQAVATWGVLSAFRFVPLVIPALVVTLVGLGRLYLGTHYLGDVLGAVVIGGLLVGVYVRVWPRVHTWLLQRRSVFHLLLAVGVAAGTVTWMVAMGGNARRYEVYGIVLGLAAGLPLENRLVRYGPGEATPGRAAAKLLIGLLGIMALLVWDRSQSPDSLLLGTFTAGFATLWATVGAPALFAATGLGESSHRPIDPATVSSRTACVEVAEGLADRRPDAEGARAGRGLP